MNNKIITALLAGTILSMSAPLMAASFDCRKASTGIEKVICDDPKLSRLDSEMGSLYHKVKHLPDMKSNQRGWVHHRNTFCGSSDGCLIGETEDRIVVLKRVLKRSKKHGNTSSAKHSGTSKKHMLDMEGACEMFVVNKFNLPMAAVSVSSGHGKDGRYTIPVSIDWDDPLIKEHGTCQIVNGSPVDYIRS